MKGEQKTNQSDVSHSSFIETYKNEEIPLMSEESEDN